MRTRQSPTIPFGIVSALFPTAFLEIAVVIDASRFLSARQIAQNQKLWKKIPTKTHRNTDDEGKR